ncbi:hypothetical protein N7448_000625 [Penicillium atrosanguineum]|uniref:Uncharacterized protein n=1 Tax=Penicillium atrosanguineum TaxID=1132637 RepID=A0A9W9HIB4_9EURO|nr:FMN-dependent dehydrogenase-domain-containing protein [Penicillium atrosanguineum]KAJ5134352.1 hypothetical protein N7526_005717 [Penicillium atrosanguineum]KAJ5149047.1 hypothetical protein N7448_000625 [Penicillium atrosanguineum]KAJ5304360.1 FMN-dependent dehydrogenase-domain-containing protein [Penicillium atrosanguineum]KAJ5323833.1 hypothetical protein N7476_002433 [Penicillium atrosanguineum]
MFHSFQALNQGRVTNSISNRQANEKNQRKSLIACTSCQRRKIKCDGKTPCNSCRWYKKADRCEYGDRTPSWGQVERLSAEIENHRKILKMILPDVDTDSLVGLSREKLLELTAKEGSQSHGEASHLVSPATSPSRQPNPHFTATEDPSLESLQSIPEDQPSDSPEMNEDVSDDVNALRLSTNPTSSYLGISSIQAALKVIVWLDPTHTTFLPSSSSVWNGTSDAQLQYQQADPSHYHPPFSETHMVNAYFVYIHPFTPLIDKEAFWKSYLAGDRTDDRWLALLNIVLALGCIAEETPSNVTHRSYFNACKKNLDLSALGKPHLETIQTLGLLGGWYSHYISQPNLAWSLLGAALRMAAAMGIDRETKEIPHFPPVGLRCRVWWSLVCMDTWASMTLGRPSMGRFSVNSVIRPLDNEVKIHSLETFLLIENVRFAKIATDIQELLALSPLIPHPELAELDRRLLQWWESHTQLLKYYESHSESVTTVLAVVRWRFYNQRMLLYRPILLSYAMRRISYSALRPEERLEIAKCREMADLHIKDIAATVRPNQLSGWNAVWWTFQLALIPLISLFLNDSTARAEDSRASFESCQAQVQLAMTTLERIQSYGHKAERSLNVISHLFEASKRALEMGDGDSGASDMSGKLGDEGDWIFPSLDTTDDQYLLWEYLSWSDNDFWVDTRNEG